MLFSDYQDILSQFKNFNHAIIEKYETGPRQELTLYLRPLLWKGSSGFHSTELTKLRFGGISDLADAKQFLDTFYNLEIAFIRFNPDSKKMQLIIEIAAERTDESVQFQCRNISIENPPNLDAL